MDWNAHAEEMQKVWAETAEIRRQAEVGDLYINKHFSGFYFVTRKGDGPTGAGDVVVVYATSREEAERYIEEMKQWNKN